MKKVVIIGSGFSSLAASCYLAKAGFQVTVLEKNDQIGGRASILEADGFRFDRGPSWYWMPDVFERFFADFGHTVADFYELVKLSPAYRVFFEGAEFVDIPDNPEAIVAIFEKLDPGSGTRLKTFMKKAKKNYEIAMGGLVYRPGESLTELISWPVIRRLHLFVTSIAREAKQVTLNKNLQRILEFPVLFLGAKPQDTPAFYSFMNYADFGLGTWYPKGGMTQVVLAMEKLAVGLGVTILCNHEVSQITVSDSKVTSIAVNGTTLETDLVVSGADYAHTETLLPDTYRNYSQSYWKKKTFAPSSLLYYIGLKGDVKGLQHHNLFFDTDFEAHTRAIYNHPQFPEKPLFYANFPSQNDESLAPLNSSSAFFLIPVGVDLEDTEAVREHYLDLIFSRIKAHTAVDLKDKVVFKKSVGVTHFKERYHACRGNAYGLANTLMQTSVLRPSLRNKKLGNLFYTGQLTVPGPGVPPALISGKLVSELIINAAV
ncbi:phytoene desaturase family protein [Pareuzebyella sediminis]|uniref:phytoene desaturase family protein n=1 Tax=Pareuzebyella sediminis TaxID=2607998 RepID=UPI0011EE8A20|nr:phytoene desaturase family protein [Pareuzebyella sediminis]